MDIGLAAGSLPVISSCSYQAGGYEYLAAAK
jgi:hypothetical protein